MKCLPASKLPQANGIVIHDWHAEVLTLRAFNRFILDECRRLAKDGAAESEFLRRRTSEERLSASDGHYQPFAWKESLTLHMYCSEAPCTFYSSPYLSLYLILHSLLHYPPTPG